MNTQQQTRPVITPAMREQATKQPNTWLYVVDPIFTDPSAEIPPWGFIGGYRVDERGELTDDFSPNPNYRPSPVALRLPAPTNDLERALQLTTTGYAQGQTLLTALLEAEVILFAQPQGSGLFTMEHESGRRQLQVFTSDAYLPPNWTTWQRMTGWQIAAQKPAGLDIQINPTSPVKARIPGEDLVKAANMATSTESETRAAIAPVSGTPALTAGPSNGTSTSATAPPTGTSTAPPVGDAPAPTTPAPSPPHSMTQPVKRKERTREPAETDFGQRFLGSILAGAVADALGAAIEFYPVDQIRSRYGEQGVVDYDRSTDRPGEFTDDTQMILFTLEGIIRGHIAHRNGISNSPLPAVQLAYQRWLHTQGYAWTRAAGPFAEKHPEPTGWLIKQRDLFSVRSPSSSCITALREFASTGAPGTFEHSINDSQDCGGVVRAAPAALWSDSAQEVFELAAATAALSSSNPNGYLPAGVQAVLVHRLLRGESIEESLRQARSLLTGYAGHEQTERLLQTAVELAEQGTPAAERIKDNLGGGWSGHEALAIAVCAALSTESVAPAIMASINHSGDSDSTGSICGNIVGARYGSTALPGVWLRDLQQRELVETAAKDALLEFGDTPSQDPTWLQRYPSEQDFSELDFSSTLKPAEAASPAASDAPPDSAPLFEPTGSTDSPRQDSDPEAAGTAEADQPPAAGSAGSAGETETAAAEQSAGAAEPTEAESAVAHEPAEPAGEAESAASKSTTAEPAEPAGEAEPAVAHEPAEPTGEAESAASESTTAEPAGETETAVAHEPAEPAAVARDDVPDDRTARIVGCLLGGAIGDALGYPIQEDSLETIREKYGESGLTDLVEGHRPGGSISDDTQMTLFTLEGLVRASIRRRLHGETEPAPQVQHAYQRWLHTQGFDWKEAGGALAGDPPDGWLIEQKGLFVRRTPGATCVQALHGYASGTKIGSFAHRLNNSKGCGGVIRAAPAGLWSDDPAEVFRVGAVTAVLTHGHSSGFLPAGAMAVIVQQLLAGQSLPNAVDRALTELSTWDGHEETLNGLRSAIELAASGHPDPEQINEWLGSGRVGEEALSIAVFAALTCPQSFGKAVALAANHSGDSDSTAAVCGNIMGAAQTVHALPAKWREKLELREVIEELAQDAAREFGPNPPDEPEWLRRYPVETGESAPTEEGAIEPSGEDDRDASSSAAEPTSEETESAQEPVAQDPAEETSAAEAPGVESPVPEEPVTKEPVVKEPVAKESTVEQPAGGEPGTQRIVYRGAVAEEPVPQKSTTWPESPKQESPKQEPAAQPSATQEPTTQQIAYRPSAAENPEDQRSVQQPTESRTSQLEPDSSTPSVTETTAAHPVGGDGAQTEQPPNPDALEETDEPDGVLSDEELRLLAAWRKFRDGDDDTPTDLSQGLRKLLVEAFGEERAAQLVGDAHAEESAAGQLAAEAAESLGRDERLAGCVLGGAVGDALAAPWMFADLHTILRDNPNGVREYSECFGRRGAVTALGQQSVFVLDGLVRALIRSRQRGVGGQIPSMVRLALQHWVCTQGARFEPAIPAGPLTESAVLGAQRFPDEMSLSALTRNARGQAPTPRNPPNNAKGATATVRAAAVGFHADTPQAALSLGAEVTVLTHGHPDGYLPGGALAGMISAVQNGQTLAESVQTVLSHLEVFEGSDATAQKLRSAVEFAAQGPVSSTLLEELGAGWNAPEALAIAVAAALSHPNALPDAVSLAATHSGNSAATAAICGSLMGAARGARAIPAEWLENLESREILQQLLADDERIDAEIRADGPVPDWAHRYLG